VNPNYSPAAPSALILSPDPLAGALIGAAVELAGVAPVFPREAESPKLALRRLRPMCLLLDCDDSAVLDEGLLGPAMMTGVYLCLFGSEPRIRDHQQLVARYRFGVLVLPQDIGRLAEILTRAIESSRRPRESTAR
jgi:hypothetical protein